MDLIREFLLLTLSPAYYVALEYERVYWLYLLSALVIGYGCFAAGITGAARGRRGIAAFLSYGFPSDVYFHPSARLDFLFFWVNAVFKLALFGALLKTSPLVHDFSMTVFNTLLPEGLWFPGGFLGGVFLTLCVVLISDLGIFIAHTLQHRVPILWEFHKIHHSAQRLVPYTVYRMHPLDDLLVFWVVATLLGIWGGFWAAAAPGDVKELEVMGINGIVFLFYLGGYNLRHTHIWLPYTGWLGRIFISPAHHQIHHSADPAHWNKNQGFIFAFWDAMAGSLVVPEKTPQPIVFGIGGNEDLEYRSILRLYFLPFVKVAGMVSGKILR